MQNDLRYSQACIDHRKKLNMPELDENSRRIPCNEGRFCYDFLCPIFVKPKGEPKDLGQGFKSDGTRYIPANLKDEVNVEVFKEIGDDKPKKKKKEMSVREFLNIQMRVLEKLSWHPEIYEALDNLPSTEILDRLLGKTGLEGVATHVGGDMKLKASPKTKKLFENLEKQFADEDEKKGKGAPPNYETVGHLPTDNITVTWVDEPFKKVKDQGDYEREFREQNDFREKEKKKDVKKTSKK